MEAIKAAVFLHNQTSTTSLPDNKTPYEVWYDRKPDISFIRSFGCLANVLIHKPERDGKYSAVSEIGIVTGHTDHNRNYRIFMLDSNKVIITHDATFREDSFPFLRLPTFDISHLASENDAPPPLVIDPDAPVVNPPARQDDDIPPQDVQVEVEVPIVADSPVEPEPPAPEPIPERRSARQPQPVDRYLPGAYSAEAFIDPIDSPPYTFATQPTVRLINEPATFKEAMNSPYADKWKEACKIEMESMKRRNVWTLVKRPKDTPVVGVKWHFRVKKRPDGSIIKFKARFVCKRLYSNLWCGLRQNFRSNR